MRKILISIKPKWVKKILNGEKTLEIRKTAPKCELPCEVYIYCTKENAKYFIDNKIYNAMMNGKVVAKFTLNKVSKILSMLYGADEDECAREHCYETRELDSDELLKRSCLTYEQMRSYLGCLDDEVGYAWHIDHLVPFDRPKELKEFEFPNPSGIRYIGQRAIKGLPIEKRAPQSWCYCEVDE